MKKYERGLERSGVSKAEQKKMIEAFLDDLIQFKWRSSRNTSTLNKCIFFKSSPFCIYISKNG